MLISFLSCFSQEEEGPEYIIYNNSVTAGELFSFGEKAMKFIRVISDSRCPTGVTCVWAGEAKILVEFFEKGRSQGEKVISNTKLPLSEFFKSDILNIIGFTLNPYPDVDKRINPEDYKISLRVSEKMN